MIGEKIRKIRTIKGYSQEYVSDLLKISQAAYSDIETGKTKITIQRLKEIASIFDLEVNYLINFSEKVILENTTSNDLKGCHDEKNILISLFDNERELYKDLISNLKKEIIYLRNKLDKL
jgi:transcriptional regulator with XRE-family HTH domain